MPPGKITRYSDRLTEGQREEVLDMFQRLDPGKDGWVNQEKLAAAISTAGTANPSPAALARVLKKMDTTGAGGANGAKGSAGGRRVTQHDFVEYCAHALWDDTRGVRYEEVARGEQALLLAQTGSKLWDLLVLFRRKQMIKDFVRGGSARVALGDISFLQSKRLFDQQRLGRSKRYASESTAGKGTRRRSSAGHATGCPRIDGHRASASSGAGSEPTSHESSDCESKDHHQQQAAEKTAYLSKTVAHAHSVAITTRASSQSSLHQRPSMAISSRASLAELPDGTLRRKSLLEPMRSRPLSSAHSSPDNSSPGYPAQAHASSATMPASGSNPTTLIPPPEVTPALYPQQLPASSQQGEQDATTSSQVPKAPTAPSMLLRPAQHSLRPSMDPVQGPVQYLQPPASPLSRLSTMARAAGPLDPWPELPSSTTYPADLSEEDSDLFGFGDALDLLPLPSLPSAAPSNVTWSVMGPVGDAPSAGAGDRQGQVKPAMRAGLGLSLLIANPAGDEPEEPKEAVHDTSVVEVKLSHSPKNAPQHLTLRVTKSPSHSPQPSPTTVAPCNQHTQSQQSHSMSPGTTQAACEHVQPDTYRPGTPQTLRSVCDAAVGPLAAAIRQGDAPQMLAALELAALTANATATSPSRLSELQIQRYFSPSSTPSQHTAGCGPETLASWTRHRATSPSSSSPAAGARQADTCHSPACGTRTPASIAYHRRPHSATPLQGCSVHRRSCVAAVAVQGGRCSPSPLTQALLLQLPSPLRCRTNSPHPVSSTSHSSTAATHTVTQAADPDRVPSNSQEIAETSGLHSLLPGGPTLPQSPRSFPDPRLPSCLAAPQPEPAADTHSPAPYTSLPLPACSSQQPHGVTPVGREAPRSQEQRTARVASSSTAALGLQRAAGGHRSPLYSLGQCVTLDVEHSEPEDPVLQRLPAWLWKELKQMRSPAASRPVRQPANDVRAADQVDVACVGISGAAGASRQEVGAGMEGGCLLHQPGASSRQAEPSHAMEGGFDEFDKEVAATMMQGSGGSKVPAPVCETATPTMGAASAVMCRGPSRRPNTAWCAEYVPVSAKRAQAGAGKGVRHVRLNQTALLRMQQVGADVGAAVDSLRSGSPGMLSTCPWSHKRSK